MSFERSLSAYLRAEARERFMTLTSLFETLDMEEEFIRNNEAEIVDIVLDMLVLSLHLDRMLVTSGALGSDYQHINNRFFNIFTAIARLKLRLDKRLSHLIERKTEDPGSGDAEKSGNV